MCLLAQSNHLRSLVRSAVKLILDSWCYTNSTLEIKVNGRKAGEHAWYIILYMPILLSLKLQKRSCKNKFDFLAIISIFHAVQIDIVAEIIMYLYNDHKNLQVHCTLPFWNRSVLRTLTWIVNVFGITCLSTKLFFARLLWLVHGSVKGNKQGFAVNVIDQNCLLNVLAHKSFSNLPARSGLRLVLNNFSIQFVYDICS